MAFLSKAQRRRQNAMAEYLFLASFLRLVWERNGSKGSRSGH